MWGVYEGSESWRQDTLFIDTEGFVTYEDLPDYRPFPENAKYASLQLYPYVPGSRSEAGTVWFDDFQFIDLASGENLLTKGDFEQKAEDLDLKLDFSEFDVEARKYLDGMGFTGFRTGFPGLRSGPYVGKKQVGSMVLLMEPRNMKSSLTFTLKGFKIISKLTDG